MIRDKNLFLQQILGKDVTFSFLASDMSKRVYDRVFFKDKSYVLMDSPNTEETQRFFDIANLLLDKGLAAPKIYASNLEQGFLLLEDFGDNTLTQVFNKSLLKESIYYTKAIDILIKTQECFFEKPQTINDYDLPILLNESNLFVEYYIPYIRGENFEESIKKDWSALWEIAFKSIDSLTPKTLVLRDYHVDNLIVLKNDQLGILDFQDALWGSVMYDFISLMEDARRYIDPDITKEMTALFLKDVPLSKHQDYKFNADVLGAGRHAKVLGVFTRYASLYKNESKLCHLNHVRELLFKALERSEQKEILYFLKDQKL